MSTYDDDIINADALPKWRYRPDRPLLRLRPHPITDDLGAVAEHLEAAADILGIGVADLPIWLTTHVGAVGQLVTADRDEHTIGDGYDDLMALSDWAHRLGRLVTEEIG